MKKFNFIADQAVGAMYDAEARSGHHTLHIDPDLYTAQDAQDYNSMIRDFQCLNVACGSETRIVENKHGEKIQVTVNPDYPISFGDLKKSGLI